jgi:hypothetical protein
MPATAGGESMADEEQVKRLQQGVLEWNKWRNANREIPVDLSGADLSDADLRGAVLTNANLGGTNLHVTNLSDANLSGADLRGANLGITNLSGADLRGAIMHSVHLATTNLSGANLSGADLSQANLYEANLSGADLSGASLFLATLHSINLKGANLIKTKLNETIFSTVDLTGITGLEQCIHNGPSTIDHRTLQISGPLPLAFLRGVGLPDNFIEYLPSLLNQPIQHYSCFISYSSQDDEFAHRIHADLQNSEVRCWFAPHDLPIGDKILDALDAAIRLRDKVVLILSEHSIKSDWVEDEVTAGFEEERKRGQIVLFPVRLDEAVLHTNEAWASKLRGRNIGDFRNWKDHDVYKKSFARVLRDLTKPQAQ